MNIRHCLLAFNSKAPSFLADCSWKSTAFLFSVSESMRFHETKINGQFPKPFSQVTDRGGRIKQDDIISVSKRLSAKSEKDALSAQTRSKTSPPSTGTSRTCDPCHPFEVHAKAFPCQGARHFLTACLDPSVAQRLHFLITIYQRPTRGLPTVLPDFQGKNLYAIDFGCGFMRCTATAVPAWWS